MVDQFRGGPRRPPIHPLETALFFVVAAHLAMLPWALGAVRLPTQVCSLALAVAGFVLALIPREHAAVPGGDPAFRLVLLPKLLRFPIFWLGLALLGLIVVQGLNPAWAFQTNGKAWWMSAVKHVAWLPTGVDVPFVAPPNTPQGGPWRMLLIYSSAWLTVCSIWVGMTRRRTLQRLFLVLAGNGVALALFGFAQIGLEARKVFWTIETRAEFFSSFIYKNHAGGYLLLTLTMAAALAAWHYVRSVRRLDKSSPAGLFAFFVTCIAVSIFISYARGATFVMLAYLTVLVAAFTWFQWRLPAAARSPVITIALLLVFGFFLKTGLQAVRTGRAWSELRAVWTTQDVSVKARQAANQGSLEMLKERGLGGVGAGGYQFLFPFHQKKIPQLTNPPQFWQHAHNDVLQLPIELGLAGTLLIVASFAYWAVVLLRNYAWQNPLSASVIVGLLFLVAMSWGEFIFYCPAILITWCALWPAVARWTVLEEARG